MSAVVDKKIELPSGWMEVSDAHCQQKQYCIVSYQKADGCAPLVVTHSLVIDKAGEWQLNANGHLVDTVPDKINLRFTRVKCEIFHLTTGECFPVNNQNYRVFAGKLITRNLFSRE